MLSRRCKICFRVCFQLEHVVNGLLKQFYLIKKNQFNPEKNGRRRRTFVTIMSIYVYA